MYTRSHRDADVRELVADGAIFVAFPWTEVS